MGIRDMFNYLNLLRSTPKKIMEETRKKFTIGLVGSPDFVSRFYDTLAMGMAREDLPAGDGHHFIKVLGMPVSEETRKTLKLDAIVYLLSLKDATRDNLLNYRDVYKVNSPAHLFIEEPKTYEEKETLFKLMDGLHISGREWIRDCTEEAVQDKADVILELNKKISTALAFRFPVLRLAMSKKLTHATGMQNLVVAMASSLPSNLPVVGIIIGFLAAAGETTVITINQLKMCLQMAGIYGLDMNMVERLKELWPLVGTAFGLRTISRTLVGFVPVAGAPIKGAIAYGGTFFIGESVRWYYLTGRKMTREERRELYKRSQEKAVSTVREFFDTVFKKYPKEMEKKHLDLDVIEHELDVLEGDMKKVVPGETTPDAVEPQPEQMVDRAESRGEAVEEAVELGKQVYELPNNPGGSMTETTERAEITNPEPPIDPAKHWDVKPDEDEASRKVIEAGKEKNWEKPGATSEMPGPDEIIGHAEHTPCDAPGCPECGKNVSS